jgi:hypothetical protein
MPGHQCLQVLHPPNVVQCELTLKGLRELGDVQRHNDEVTDDVDLYGDYGEVLIDGLDLPVDDVDVLDLQAQEMEVQYLY